MLHNTVTNPTTAELRDWREAFTINQAKPTARHYEAQFTVAVLSSGGCVDTISAIRAGYKPIWSTEICKHRQEMWQDLTGTVCHGDTFNIQPNTLQSPDYLTSGQPCIDYALSGSQTGAEGETGWMFTDQVDIILAFKPMPKAIRLEISDNALYVNDGAEVGQVISQLQEHYIIYNNILQVWRYGDPTSRARLFVVGFHKSLGPAAHTFKFPAHQYDSYSYPTLRSVAVPDDAVPPEYWRHDEPARISWKPPTPGHQHRIAQSGPGMGHSSNPNPVQSWDGLGNSQTTYNGGGRRPRLDWQLTKDGPVGPTRLAVPIETVRMASLSDSYLQWAYQFKHSPGFLRECVNNGIPNQICYAVDKAVMLVLQQTEDNSVTAALATSTPAVRSAMLDTGSNLRLMHTDIEPQLQQAQPSHYSIQVANKQCIPGSKDGKLSMQIINTEGHPDIPNNTTITRPVTTAQGISRELFTVDDLYRDGYSILLRHPTYGCGIPEIYKPANSTDPAVRLPVRYDWNKSGFWVDYVPGCGDKHSHSAESVLNHTYNTEQVTSITTAAWAMPAVTEIRYGTDTEERNILGVKAGLRHRKQQMTKREFHEEYCHLGSMPDCDICKRVAGTMRRITKVVDKHREQRRAHTWVMDGVTWSHRDNDGSKYMVVLRCKATSTFKCLCLYRRSDIRQELREWITKLRSEPVYQDMGYLAVSIIETDQAGEWGKECAEWTELEKDLKFITIYKPSDRKEEAGAAEVGCRIMEHTVKAGLMQQNLPHT